MEERAALRNTEFKELSAIQTIQRTKSAKAEKAADTDAQKAQKYLERCLERQKKAKFLENQIIELEAASGYSSPSLIGGGGSGISDRVGNMTAKLVDMKNALDLERTRCLEERAKALLLICGLPDCRLCEVLTQRYIKGKSWTVISEEMDIAKTWLYKLHTKALKSFWELFGKSIEAAEREEFLK